MAHVKSVGTQRWIEKRGIKDLMIIEGADQEEAGLEIVVVGIIILGLPNHFYGIDKLNTQGLD